MLRTIVACALGAVLALTGTAGAQDWPTGSGAGVEAGPAAAEEADIRAAAAARPRRAGV